MIFGRTISINYDSHTSKGMRFKNVHDFAKEFMHQAIDSSFVRMYVSLKK